MTHGVPNRQIAEEAADWAVRLDAGTLDESERRLLAGWLAASPAHVDELLFAASIFGSIEGVDAGRNVSIDDLLAAQAPEVVPLFAAASREAVPPVEGIEPVPVRASGLVSALSARWMAVAATLLLMAVSGTLIGWSLWDGGQATTIAYDTMTGEQRSIPLEDGSIVSMNTNSRLRVTLSSTERRIDLLSGEALFDVVHDGKRPFRVYAGDTMTQAVGTKFNVQQDRDGVHVMVVEGKVLVRNRAGTKVLDGRRDAGEVLVTAGNRADMEPHFAAPRVSPTDMSEVALWRTRQLSFDNETLASIAAEFNRYNRLQMVVADARLANTRFSGEFSSNDPVSFLAFLELTPGIHVDRSDPDRAVLVLRRP